MLTEIEVLRLEGAEKAAKEILEHVDAIKRLQRDTAWQTVSVKVTLREDKAASGN